MTVRTALDADIPTLHIRCGSDIRERLHEAGFDGDFLQWAYPLCLGPVTDGDDWLAQGAAFVAGAFGAPLEPSDALAGLLAEEDRLHHAAARAGRVVMWFEHDSYDQLVLARCLAVFADAMPRRLELVSVDRYPAGFENPKLRFIGLGQLPAEALPGLWHRRQPVSLDQAQAGAAVWEALRAPDPTQLVARAGADLPLPHLAGALRRHCRELPGVGDGLSLTQRLILRLLAEAPHTAGETFRDLQHEREPLPWLGDIMLHHIVECMKLLSAPVFTGDFPDAFPGGEQRWFKERLTITPLGRAVLAGAVDFLSLAPPERWVGGVRIAPGAPCWRWDEAAATAVWTHPPS